MDYICIKRTELAKYNVSDKWSAFRLLSSGITFCHCAQE